MYTKEQGLYVAHGPNGPISICGKMANRHGLIALFQFVEKWRTDMV